MTFWDRGLLDVSDPHASPQNAQGDILVIERAPASAIQALYHAATGKTENLQKRFTKNFIVRKNDIEQLYFKILQQLDHFERVAGPTVTIKISFHNHESQQFSSWERFKLFDSGKAEIVSDVVFKIEFLLRFPELSNVQRYVLNIDIDSKLPMLSEDDKAKEPILRFFPRLDLIPSLTVSIDFIDYLCAKILYRLLKTGLMHLKNLQNGPGVDG